MAKKGGNPANDQAATVAADEKQRQTTIRAGTQRINSIFDGGPSVSGATPFGQADPNKNYFTADGKPFDWSAAKPSMGLLPTIRDGPAGALPDTLFTTATPGSGGFNDDFYNNLQKNFVNYQTPQLDKQFGDAQRALTYSLTRSGNLDSSTRAKQEADLTGTYAAGRQQIADGGLSYANDARNKIEAAREGLISTLNTTGDATGTANQAITRADMLSTPAPFSPLTSLFSNATAALGTQAQAERAEKLSGGLVKAPFNTGLFGTSSAVKVT